MGEFGLKIKNIKAGTLFGYNQGVRGRYDFTEAMFSNSLFSDFIIKNGLDVWKEESTRDIICLDFEFGSRSFEEEMEHLYKMMDNEDATEESIEKIKKIMDSVQDKSDLYVKYSKEEIREHFYKHGVPVEYKRFNKDGTVKDTTVINYKMIYRSSAKAKIGQVMFINEKLYDIAYDWLTMGIGNKMDVDNAKIVEMSAYAPLTTSTIVGRWQIPVEDILILEDQDSLFETIAKVVKAEDYTTEIKVLDEEKTENNRLKAIEKGKLFEDGTPKYNKSYKKERVTKKMCVVSDEIRNVKNTLWDGMALIESDVLPDWVNGMALLRNHFFKACGVRTYIQKFIKDWCEKNKIDYDTYEIVDMFGISHKAKDIKMITTNNAIKWIKFKEFMGDDLKDAYLYWCNRINSDGSVFGIVKTDHPSKLGNVQQMSYQMVNTLPCSKEDISELAKTSIEYVELIKNNNIEFLKFLRRNANEINHYNMMADLYEYNRAFGDSQWFKYEKSNIIMNYIDRLRKGKITIGADNLTVFGNPYGLLMYAVGEDWNNDPTLNFEGGVIQCYTKRFDNGEYLAGIRNPHNSPNNISYLKNVYSKEFNKYFKFSENILAVNCIHTDIQDRCNGMDFDSDFMFVTNNSIMVKCAKKAYEEFPTIVNALNESGITYQNTLESYAEMDNKFAKSRLGIGESSNLAQLAMTYYWSNPSKDLYDNFVILSVLAQVIIDGCKREYEVDGVEEIKRIKKLSCMNRFHIKENNDGKRIKERKDFPMFMKYTKEVKHTKNGKERQYSKVKSEKKKILSRIDYSLVCPMNWLQESLNAINNTPQTLTIPTSEFFIKMSGDTNRRVVAKIVDLVKEYDFSIKNAIYRDDEAIDVLEIKEATEKIISQLNKIRIRNLVSINRLIEVALKLEKSNNKNKNIQKYSKKILMILHKYDKEKFLSNFRKG